MELVKLLFVCLVLYQVDCTSILCEEGFCRVSTLPFYELNVYCDTLWLKAEKIVLLVLLNLNFF